MEQENLNYLSNYQKLRFEDGEDLLQLANIERKCVIQTLSASSHLLSNAENCMVLKANLQKNTQRMTDANEFIDNKISQTLQNSSGLCGNWETGLNKIDFDSLMSPLPCTKINNTRCKLPGIKKELQPVSKHFKQLAQAPKIAMLPAEAEPKVCKIAKSSAPVPQCGAPKKQENDEKKPTNPFRTANDVLAAQDVKKCGRVKRKLGLRRGVRGKFVSPMLSNNESSSEESSTKMEVDENVDERLKNINPHMVEMIRSEIMNVGTAIAWDDIAGLNFAKTIIKESVVLPLLRPDIFTGLRRPPRGILLFGPPGTGKTLIGKCVAAQSKSTFFSISASSLTSKWFGEGEKMVRALFTVARCHQPAVVFIDEIDSLLTQRNETEHESTRRIKTEFFVQLDGATTDSEDRILLIGATNRPQELDEAARRRFEKRIYIPLPEFEARLQLVVKLMSQEQNTLANTDMEQVAHLSEGYSGADMRQLCSEASMGPIRSIDFGQIEKIDIAQVRPINMQDFKKALTRVKASVATKDLDQYVAWNQTYGSGN